MSSSEKILIVDDSDDVRFSLSRRMTRLGFTDIHTASDGDEAIEKLQANDFDLVLLDVMMPRVTGLDVLAFLGKDARLDRVRVIAMSALDDIDTAIRCISAGADDFLTKPINNTLLAARINGIMERKRLQDEVTEQLQLIRGVLGRYVPDSVLHDVVRGAGTLEPREAFATVLYTDLQGFTGIVEQQSPAEAFSMLNSYFSAVTEPILKFGGTITQFQGDAMLVVFNVPVESESHADDAVAAAWEIPRINQQETFDGVRLTTRMGVNSGHLVAGTVATAARVTYTVHGDAVNVAARLEQLNKQTGTELLVSESTVKAMTREFALAKAFTQRIRGRQEPLEVFTPSSSVVRQLSVG